MHVRHVRHVRHADLGYTMERSLVDHWDGTGNGCRANSLAAKVREILGINHEEEVKAPAEFHVKKKELKDQQEKVRVLRKKWPGTQ